MASRHVEKIIDHLWRATEETPPPERFAILDAARNDKIYPKLLETNVPAVCLFRGDKARELAHVAPYLVQLDPEFTRWLLETGWGKSWGIFVVSTDTLDQLKHHFRSILTVYDEDGNSLFFRYYDPRVLRVYLPTCNESELKIFFGEINRYVAEGEDGDTAIDYLRAAGQLSQHTVQLQMEALSKYMLEQFENRMVDHLRDILAVQTEDMTTEDLRHLIRQGVDKAEAYKITDELEVETYLECMVQYGVNFDTDTQTSWAGEILRDERFSETDKMQRIDEHRMLELVDAEKDLP
jgi:hypothetical protein